MNIAIYSGSFNPIHNGHLQLAGYLTDNQLADEVWFVVSPCNPLKEQPTLIDEYLRLDMVILSISGNDKFKASDVEFTMPIPSYTIDTLHRLSELFPEHRFSLVIGSDNALVFDQWKNPEQILNEYDVFVYPRNGYDFQLVAAKYPKMQLLDTPIYEISSTEIRGMIRENKATGPWLHPMVAAYIKENSLYI
ncbi:MAG: nicotinate (nicotinamide) nucleotide adenylyltransferase [Paludibacter sp.]|nr:nicotinate (nicotinamide) nucleotide adenylyltransferase [Paludibacter sp.]